MPLYDVTYKKNKLIDPGESGSFEVIDAIRRKRSMNTFNRIKKTIDEAVDSVEPSKKSRLVWTKAGALFGPGSLQPHKNVEHLWENIIKSVGNDRMCLIALGSLLRWRISKRPEKWLVYRRESDVVDAATGKTIKISEYWIDEDFVFRHPKAPATKMDFNKLKSAWGNGEAYV